MGDTTAIDLFARFLYGKVFIRIVRIQFWILELMGELVRAALRCRIDDTIFWIAKRINRSLKVKIFFIIRFCSLCEDNFGVAIAYKFVCCLIDFISERAIHAWN